MISHLYVHIPFCPKVCPYCSFYKEAESTSRTMEFVETLLTELELRLQTGIVLQPRTIFFGGGTPSALTTAQLERLLTGLKEWLDLSALEEWTLEMNPATVSSEKAGLLHQLGVNRISMGVQSWDPTILETLGRVHSAAQAEKSYEILREAGFANVNLDHIFGVPGQSLASWQSTLEKSIRLAPEHVSAYNLTYEEDTEFFKKFQSGEYQQNADNDAEFFTLTRDCLADAGYPAYEISNFAKPGRECRHNLAYWAGQDYLGLGPSAWSTVGGLRWENIRDTRAYMAALREKQLPPLKEENLGPEELLMEKIAFGLRTDHGVPEVWLRPQSELVAEYQQSGWLERCGENLRLTSTGRLVADEIAAALC